MQRCGVEVSLECLDIGQLRHWLIQQNRSMYSFNATALLCSVSFAPKSKVTVRFLAARASCSTCSRWSSSSAEYLFLNSLHLPGSCANHFRNAVLGAISFSHWSIR